MDDLEELDLRLKHGAFECLKLCLQGRREPEGIHLEQAEEVFGEAIRGLESMTSGVGYYPVADLRGKVEAMGYKSESYTAERIRQITAGFKGILADLMKLEENPQAVYRDREKRTKLLEACERMRKFYSGKIPDMRVLRCEDGLLV